MVVDLAAGTGAFAIAAARYLGSLGFGDRVKVIAVDKSEEALEICRGQLLNLRCGVDLVLDDLLSPCFADRLRGMRPDFIVANHVLEHLTLDNEVVVTTGDPFEPLKNAVLHDWILAAAEAVSAGTTTGTSGEFCAAWLIGAATSLPRRKRTGQGDPQQANGCGNRPVRLCLRKPFSKHYLHGSSPIGLVSN